MHAFIVTGGSSDLRKEFVKRESSKSTELIHVVTEKSSITIKQIQELSGPLAISPRLPRVVWIEEASLMTVPAQNSLLKMLEEPPEATTFYLTCDSKLSLLSTILSRSKVVQLSAKVKIEDPMILIDLKEIMKLSPGDRLAYITKRDRAESIAWMTSVGLSLKAKLHDQSLTPKSANMLAKIAKLAINAHIQFVSNCSVRLATENFYLLLPHTYSKS